MKFLNREHAGLLLAAQVRRLHFKRPPLVVALPRGGVPVGYPLALALHAPMDVLFVRKIGAPNNPEFGIGAVAETGEPYIDEENAAFARASAQEIQAIVQEQRREISRQGHLFRPGIEHLRLKGRSVILVDDGIATGVTVLAAIRAVREIQASQFDLLVAVPVCSEHAAMRIEPEVDRFTCLLRTDTLSSVGQYYEDFEPVTDREVCDLLRVSSFQAFRHSPIPRT